MPEQFYYANEDGTEYRRPRWWLGYVAGGVMLALGVVLPCAGLIIAGYSTQSPVGATFKPPGKLSVQITEPGQQVIWVDEPDGDSVMGNTPRIPSDFVATVTSPNGSDVPARPPAEELTASTMHTSRNGAAIFGADFKGAYVVEVKGSFSVNQIIAVTPDQSHKDAAAGLGAVGMILIAIVLLGGGVLTLIITGVRHANAGKSVV